MGFFPPEMPLPEIEPLTEPYWAACREHRLVIQRCTDCGTFRHLPHVMCAKCQSSAYEWVPSSGRGTVFTYTIVVHPVHDAVVDVVPYNVVVVQLADCGGVLVPGNVIDCDPDDVHVGMPVEVAWDDVTPEVTIPRFKRVT